MYNPNNPNHAQILNDQHLDELKAQKLIWCSIRATEIERNGHYRTKEAKLARSERNEVIHGGNIVGDIEVLEFLKAETTQQRQDFLRAAFEAWYEISLRFEHQILRVPELVVSTFNTLADTKTLWGWSDNPTAQDEAQKICRGIISKWLEYVDTPGGEYPEDYIRLESEKLVSLKSG